MKKERLTKAMRPQRGGAQGCKRAGGVYVKDAHLPARFYDRHSRDGMRESAMSYIDAIEREELLQFIRRQELMKFIDGIAAA